MKDNEILSKDISTQFPEVIKRSGASLSGNEMPWLVNGQDSMLPYPADHQPGVLIPKKRHRKNKQDQGHVKKDESRLTDQNFSGDGGKKLMGKKGVDMHNSNTTDRVTLKIKNIRYGTASDYFDVAQNKVTKKAIDHETTTDDIQKPILETSKDTEANQAENVFERGAQSPLPLTPRNIKMQPPRNIKMQPVPPIELYHEFDDEIPASNDLTSSVSQRYVNNYKALIKEKGLELDALFGNNRQQHQMLLQSQQLGENGEDSNSLPPLLRKVKESAKVTEQRECQQLKGTDGNVTHITVTSRPMKIKRLGNPISPRKMVECLDFLKSNKPLKIEDHFNFYFV